MATIDDLEYYIGYRPDEDIVREAEVWKKENPDISLAEWCSAMEEIGAV